MTQSYNRIVTMNCALKDFSMTGGNVHDMILN